MTIRHVLGKRKFKLITRIHQSLPPALKPSFIDAAEKTIFAYIDAQVDIFAYAYFQVKFQ